MRISSVLVAAASACLLAGSLTACSGPTSGSSRTAAVPASSAAPSAGTALDLVGTRWHVTGRSGTTVRFDGLAVTVAEGGRSTSFAWSAQGDEVLVGGGPSALGGPVAAAWLTSTARVQRSGAGWTLLDAAGRVTAHLAAGGSAGSTTPTTLLAAGTPGPGVVDVPAHAIEGRWTLPGDLRSSITFTSGTWRATSSCTSGAVGGAGVYRVLPGGRLLVTRTLAPIRGCPVVDGPVLGQATAITAIARAASFRVHADRLTLFDRSGAVLGSLMRG